jgi:DNA-binding MarR family transcriptional regulator
MGTHTSAAPPPSPDGAGQTRVVLDAVRRIVQALRVSARQAERDVGLSGAQLFVLRRLADAGGEPLSVNELATRTFTHQSTVSVVVQRLVRRGLVARHRSSRDARRVELTLAPAGLALLRRAPAAAQERLVAAVDAMPPAARRTLAASLEGLANAMGGDGRPPALFFEDDKPTPRPARRANRPPPGRAAPRQRAS